MSNNLLKSELNLIALAMVAFTIGPYYKKGLKPLQKSYYEPRGEDLAKAKGLIRYSFGDHFLYAKNDKEAIKRAKKRGYSVLLMKRHEK